MRAVHLSPMPSKLSTDNSPTLFSPQMIERDLQTEKLMAEMGQLRAALAAVTGTVASSRTASASGEALLPERSDEEWGDENVDALDPESGTSWLQRKRSPSLQVGHYQMSNADLHDTYIIFLTFVLECEQRNAPPENLGEAEADLLALAEHSKQKYLDIVGRLQQESLKSEVEFGDYVDQSVEDHEATIDSVSDEEARTEMDGDDSFLTISYNPSLKPVKGCLTKFRKRWPNRPLSPSGVKSLR